MKQIAFSILIIFAMTTCKAQETGGHNLSGKTYYHTYFHATMGNEYGRGGGDIQLCLSFSNHDVKLIKIASETLPDTDKVYHTQSDSTAIFTAPYKLTNDSVLIKNPIMPLLIMGENQLTAPKISVENSNLAIMKERSSNIWENAVFKLLIPYPIKQSAE